MGFGSLSDVSAKTARQLAMDAGRLIIEGADPLVRRHALAAQAETTALVPVTKPVTFKDAALDYIDRHSAGWRNAKHRQQWENRRAWGASAANRSQRSISHRLFAP